MPQEYCLCVISEIVLSFIYIAVICLNLTIFALQTYAYIYFYKVQCTHYMLRVLINVVIFVARLLVMMVCGKLWGDGMEALLPITI